MGTARADQAARHHIGTNLFTGTDPDRSGRQVVAVGSVGLGDGARARRQAHQAVACVQADQGNACTCVNRDAAGMGAHRARARTDGLRHAAACALDAQIAARRADGRCRCLAEVCACEQAHIAARAADGTGQAERTQRLKGDGAGCARDRQSRHIHSALQAQQHAAGRTGLQAGGAQHQGARFTPHAAAQRQHVDRAGLEVGKPSTGVADDGTGQGRQVGAARHHQAVETQVPRNFLQIGSAIDQAGHTVCTALQVHQEGGACAAHIATGGVEREPFCAHPTIDAGAHGSGRLQRHALCRDHRVEHQVCATRLQQHASGVTVHSARDRHRACGAQADAAR